MTKKACQTLRKPCARWRMGVRWCAVIFVLPPLLVLAWLNLMGVPRFLHPHISSILNQEGLNFDFESLHFHIFDGVHIQNGVLSSQSDHGHIDLQFESAKIRYALDRKGMRAKGLEILSGSLQVQATSPPTNSLPFLISRNIRAHIDFEEDQITRIHQFKGELFSGTLEMHGTITNAWSALGNISRDPTRDPVLPQWMDWFTSENELITLIQESRPIISIHLDGDALDPGSLASSISVHLDSMTTGETSLFSTDLSFTANPTQSRNGRFQIALHSGKIVHKAPVPVELEEVAIHSEFWMDPDSMVPTRATVWAGVDEASMRSPDPWQTRLPQLNLRVSFNPDAPWKDWRMWEWDGTLEAQSCHYNTGTFLDQPSISILSTPQESGDPALSLHTSFKALHAGQIRMGTAAFRLPSTGLSSLLQISEWIQSSTLLPGQWPAIQQSLGSFSVSAYDWRIQELPIGNIEIDNNANPESPHLSQSTIRLSDPSGGKIQATVQIDNNQQRIACSGQSSLDVKQWLPIFPAGLVDVLSRIHWDQAPIAEFHLGPAPFPNKLDADELAIWLSSSGQFHGQAHIQSGHFKNIPFNQLTTSFSFRDFWWSLPDIQIDRPEGRLALNFRQNDLNGHYTVDIQGPIYAQALRPLFSEKADNYFDRFTESEAMMGSITVYGPWDQGLGKITGTVEHNGLTWHGIPITSMETMLEYVDQTSQLRVQNLSVNHSGQHAHFDHLHLDWPAQSIHFDGFSALGAPNLIASLLSREPLENIQTLNFLQNAEWKGSGSIRFLTDIQPDIRLQLDCKQLTFKELECSHLLASIHWLNQSLTLTDVTADVAKGSIQSTATFTFDQPERTSLKLQAKGDNIQIPDVAKIWNPSIDLQGQTDFTLELLAEDISDIDSWSALTNATISDSVIWSIPIFGRLSQALDSIIPGLGHSSIKKGSLSATLDQGMIVIDKCQFDGTHFGLNLKGRVSTDGEVDASVIAIPFQAQNPVEKLLNMTLLPIAESLRYEISGNIKNPSVQPRYMLPRVLLNPLKPKTWIQLR